jgi:hypothetical protein
MVHAMRTSRGVRLCLGIAVVLVGGGCGARSELDVSLGRKTTTVDATVPRLDAGVPVPPCADAGCAAMSCGSPRPSPGTLLWETHPPSAETFTGPLAADPSGWTYFLGTPGPYPTTYTLVAIDACGILRWQATAATAFINDEQASVVVSGDEVIVQVGAVDGFDRATGAHLWDVSLQAVATDAGDGKLALDDGAEIGPTATASDGTSYVELETVVGAWLLAISPAGALSTVTPLHATDGTVTDMIIDAAGNIDLLFNSIQGALVRSYSPSGALLSSGTFGCLQSFLGPLASGQSFLLMQTAGCALTLQGAPTFNLGGANLDGFGAMAIDADDNVYATVQGLYSFDATGQQRWMEATSEQVIGGPLLGAGGHVFVVESATGDSTDTALTLTALDTGTGTASWQQRFTAREAALGGFPVLLTAAGEIVYASKGVVTAVAAGEGPSTDAEWATPHGGPDQRRAAFGR